MQPAGAVSDTDAEAAAPPFFETSFDCAKAQSYAEFSICSTEDLAAADVGLGSLYREALSRDVGGRVRASAREAWRERERCETLACLRAWYGRRRVELAAAE